MVFIKQVALRKQNIRVNDTIFEKLMLVYTIALEKTKNKISELQEDLNNESNYNIITNVSSRIKSSNSIINKMIKKGYNLSYQLLIENINDIAGLRIICISEKDVYRVIKKIYKLDEIHVIKKKDYIKKPKESGYSAYHLIIEIPIYLENRKVWVKVEIQVRTMAMDLWANLEHDVKYKTDSNICKKYNKNFKKSIDKTYIKIV